MFCVCAVCLRRRWRWAGVKYTQVVQPAGGWIATQGNCYHFGFLPDYQGYSEAINFVDEHWLSYGPEKCLQVLAYFEQHQAEWRKVLGDRRTTQTQKQSMCVVAWVGVGCLRF
jgi:hypothetical protein